MKQYKIKIIFTKEIRLYEGYKILFFTFWGHVGSYTSYYELMHAIKDLNSEIV